MDLLNFWVLPNYLGKNKEEKQKVIKIVFMYDLTRPVAIVPGEPYTDILPEQLELKVKELIKTMIGEDADVYNEVFEIRRGGYLENQATFSPPNNLSGGRRSSRKQTRRTGGRKQRQSQRNQRCRKQHRHTRRCA